MNIRECIKKNFKNSSIEELRESIEESVQSEDEIVLPGMGVLFEILWLNTGNQNDILKTIHDVIK